MAVKKGYFVFHKEFYDIRKEIGMKAWYELETYMLQLRFEGIDTNPQTIKNKSIKREWIMIRKKILDSIDNMNRKNRHNNTIPNEEFYNNSNKGDLSALNDEDGEMYHQEPESPSERLKRAKKEEIEVANNNTDNDMGTFIGDFKELNSKTTATTTQNVVEEKYDDFSNELKRLLNEYKGVIDQLTTMIAKANMSDDVCVVSTAKMAEMRIKNISKQLIAEIDKTNYRGYIDDKIETKTKKLQVA